MFGHLKESGKYQYLQTLNDERVNGKVKQRTIAPLGGLDILQQSGQMDALGESMASYACHTAALTAARKEQKPA